MVDIKTKHKSLLCNWIADCGNFPKIKNLAKFFLGDCVENGQIWQFNLCKQDSEWIFAGQSFGILYFICGTIILIMNPKMLIMSECNVFAIILTFVSKWYQSP